MSMSDHLTTRFDSTPAVRHPFLTAAGSLSLPAARLALYLYQDRIYAAYAYPRFIAQLISKIPRDHDLANRTLSLLVDSLNNIVREVAFFDTIANAYHLPLDRGYWRERKATRDYTAEMARIGTFSSLEDGLVFLWAMEKVYLDAWSAVYHALPSPSTSQPQADLTAKAIRDLSYNWSDANPAFLQFVKDIADLVNDYFAPVMTDQSASESLARAEATWTRVIELEAEFWPNQGEEDSLRV